MGKKKGSASAGRNAAEKAAKWAFGKIFKRSLQMIILIALGGLLFNLDRLGDTGLQLLKYKDYLPGFVVKMLPGGNAESGEARPAQILEGLAIEIYDGDTMTLLVGENGVEKKYKIRFYGIDAPESSQEYGIESRDALRGKILGEKVQVTVVSVDRYGRSVGKVNFGGRYINLEMAAEGNAWHYKDYAAGEKDLAAAEIDARKHRLGLWSRERAQEPWLFRKEKR